MLRCAVLDDYQGVAEGLADWESLAEKVAVEFMPVPLPDEDSRVSALAGFDILVAMRERTPFPASLIGRLPKLRLLVSTGMRNAAIDIAAATARGIVVCGTEAQGRGTAELTWGLILAAARHLPVEVANLRSGRWQTTLGTGLHGRTLGVIGLGTIGAQVAAVGRALGMRVIAWSPNLAAARCAEVGVEPAGSLADLLRASDVVTIHLVLGERSRGLIGEVELAAMKPEAILVNTSRGPIVAEAALVAALRDGRIAGAALDVYDVEPLPADHAYRTLSNLVATPHLGYVVEETMRGHYAQAVEDIAAWLAGAPVRLL